MLKKLLVGSSVLVTSLVSLVIGYSIGTKNANPKQMVTLFGGFMRPSKTVYITPDLLDPDYQWKQINPEILNLGDLNEDGIDDLLIQSKRFDYLGLEDLIYLSKGNSYSVLSEETPNKRDILSKVLNYCKAINYDLKGSKFLVSLIK